jgi:hypothetical protein
MPQKKYGYEVPRKQYPVSNSDDEDTLYNGKFYKNLLLYLLSSDRPTKTKKVHLHLSVINLAPYEANYNINNRT